MTRVIKIELTAFQVKFYGYRQKSVGDIIFHIDRNSEDGIKLENKLKRAADVAGDNHSVYELIAQDGKRLYILVSDDSLSIGLRLI